MKGELVGTLSCKGEIENAPIKIVIGENGTTSHVYINGEAVTNVSSLVLTMSPGSKTKIKMVLF
jgi:hypothetical protein